MDPFWGLGTIESYIGVFKRVMHTWAFLGGPYPLQAQWEYAARGPNPAPYPWGSGAPTQAGSLGFRV